MSKKRAKAAGPAATREGIYITIEENGPYMVYGAPPLAQHFMLPNAEGNIWHYARGETFRLDDPVALCRCGRSGHKPFCDGAHVDADWDGELTASEQPLLEGAEFFRGPALSLSDNREYCAYARFCDGKGQVWNLVGRSDDEQAREWTIQEANNCPAGRLSAWDNEVGMAFEPHLEPSLGLLEDPQIGCSSALWVRGGIPVVRSSDGFTYEVRNRVTLCRCGESTNKPYCDGTHASMRFHDGLPALPQDE